MAAHDRELLRIVKGSPQPELSVAEIARQLGEPEEDTHDRVERLVRAGRLRREGDRLVAVDPSIGDAPPGRQMP